MITPLITEFDRIKQQTVISIYDEKQKRETRLKVIIENLNTGKIEQLSVDEVRENSCEMYEKSLWANGKLVRKIKRGEILKILYNKKLYQLHEYAKLRRLERQENGN